jgi:hypothetical protein
MRNKNEEISVMKLITFLTGAAVGYVLGTRAGRDKYEQIVQGAKDLSEHPTVVQAQTKLKGALGDATDATKAKLKMTKDSASTVDSVLDADVDSLTDPYASTSSDYSRTPSTGGSY